MLTRKHWTSFVEAVRFEFNRNNHVTIYNEPVTQVDTIKGIIYVKTSKEFLRKRYSFEESVYENTRLQNLCDSVKIESRLSLPKPETRETSYTEDTLEPGYWYVRDDTIGRYYIVSILRNQLSDENEWMVWMTDQEGSLSIDDIGIENFIRKVDDP